MAQGCRWLDRDVRVGFWQQVRAGLSVEQASLAVGISPASGRRWFGHAGGVITNAPAPATGRFLSPAEREDIAMATVAGHCVRVIAARLGRAPSTIYRELARNSTATGGYRASVAQHAAEQRAKRPKPAKLAVNEPLRELVQHWLDQRWSPEQISARLAEQFPDQPEMHVSHETIYQGLYVQARGALRRELTVCLRTGRALRRPHRQPGTQRPRRGQIPGMVMISQRPSEATDRAVPGHWEGDLIMGTGNASAIGTLVERTTRFVMLLHLPHGRDAVSVRDAMINRIATLPVALRRSMTWDQGKEMTRHAEFTLATDMPVYFCDPHSPWQRGTNENTNGLLRQYFPKGTDLSAYDQAHLNTVAAQLNDRPRKTLGWDSPAQALTKVLSQPQHQSTGVATTD